MADETRIEDFQLTFGKLKVLSQRTGKKFFEMTDALDAMDFDLIDQATQVCMDIDESESDAFLSEPGNLLRVKRELTLALIAFVQVANAATEIDEEKKS
jgi:hypothetical protein